MTASLHRLKPAAAPDPGSGIRGIVGVEDLQRLANLAVTRTVRPGQGFIVEGDPADCFFNITCGTAKLFKLLPDGRRQIIGFATAAHFLGLAVSGRYIFGAEAIDTVRLCRFSRTRLRLLLDEFPSLGRSLLDAASAELVAAQDQMLLLGRKTARERVASFLMEMSRQPDCGTGGSDLAGLRVPLPMHRLDIADYLGLTIETVSRMLTRLCREGLISIPTTTAVLLRDPTRLQAVADGLG